MAKVTRGRRGIASRQCRPKPYPLPSQKNRSKLIKKKDWEDATCSVCMECPHNAVLLLCSSHDKGCRPYMCGTSFRYSNCLDQYKSASKKKLTNNSSSKAMELACPLCRGQVKGWTVVDPAREHLNSKKRSCVQDNCSFAGTFRELRKHVKSDHPFAKPIEVDPTLEQKWRRLERDRERDDVISTVRSSMPGAVFFGDYVIEGNNSNSYGIDDDDDDDSDDDSDDDDGVDGNLMSVFLFLESFGSNAAASGDSGLSREGRMGGLHFSDEDDDGGNYGTSLAGRLRRQGRVFLGRSGRRRRRREANGGEGR